MVSHYNVFQCFGFDIFSLVLSYIATIDSDIFAISVSTFLNFFFKFLVFFCGLINTKVVVLLLESSVKHKLFHLYYMIKRQPSFSLILNLEISLYLKVDSSLWDLVQKRMTKLMFPKRHIFLKMCLDLKQEVRKSLDLHSYCTSKYEAL